jgi:hypothetical protein
VNVVNVANILGVKMGGLGALPCVYRFLFQRVDGGEGQVGAGALVRLIRRWTGIVVKWPWQGKQEYTKEPSVTGVPKQSISQHWQRVERLKITIFNKCSAETYPMLCILWNIITDFQYATTQMFPHYICKELHYICNWCSQAVNQPALAKGSKVKDNNI